MAARKSVFKCLNPVGIQEPVEIFPLAPRLDTISGKTININITGEPDITIALERQLKTDYPDVNWTTKKTYGVDPIRLTEEELKTTDGVIMGVCW